MSGAYCTKYDCAVKPSARRPLLYNPFETAARDRRGHLKEEVRQAIIRIVLITGTTVSIFGYNLTDNPAFIPVPFIAGVILTVLILTAPTCTPEQIEARKKGRRNGFIQLVVSCVMLAVFICVAAIRHWGRDQVVGFMIMEGTLAVLAVLAYFTYKRVHLKLEQPSEDCDEP